MPDDLFAFVLTALALAGSPGPNTLSIAAMAAAYGPRQGAWWAAGITSGMLLVIALVGSGLTAALLLVPGAAPVVSVLAAAYFLYLAWRIATAPPLASQSPDDRTPAWPQAVAVSLANPKAYAAMSAMFSGFTLVAGSATADAFAKAGTLILVIVSVNVAWVVAGSAMTPLFRDPVWSRRINIAFAVALLVSVAMTLAL